MRSKVNILLIIVFTLVIFSIIILLAQRNIDSVTGGAVGNSEVCVGNTPTLDPIGNLTATANTPRMEFYYDVNATNTGGDSYVFYSSPNLFNIESSTGIINYTPEHHEVGQYSIFISANSSTCPEFGHVEWLTFFVDQGNREPVLASVTDKSVWEDGFCDGDAGNPNCPLSFYLNGSDADGDDIEYACNTTLFTVDNDTGYIEWWPVNGDVGDHWFNCNVTEQNQWGMYDSVTFYVEVLNTNDIPIIDLIPNFTVESGNPVYEDINFTYDVNATDPDGDDVFFISAVPQIIPIDYDSGIIYTVPSHQNVGNWSIIIYATDNIGPGIASQLVYFEILETNDAPVLQNKTELSAQTAQANETYYYDVNAIDEEDGQDEDDGTGNLTFYLDNTSLFDINATTGVINFMPLDTQIGNYTINITVEDRGPYGTGEGNLTDSVIMSFAITEANQPPNITAYAPQTPYSMFTTQTRTFRIEAEDPDGGTPSAQWYFEGNATGTGYSRDFGGFAVGSYNITVVVSDGKLTDEQEWAVTVTAPPAGPAPAEPGGGGGGGGKYSCKELWICEDWSTCMLTDLQIRNCIDLNNCTTIEDKPLQKRACIYVPIETCFDSIRNQDEILPDCGGICKPCPTCNDGKCDEGEQCKVCETDINDPRCPKDLEGNIIPDCGGVCPLCPKIEKPLTPKTFDWKGLIFKIMKILLAIILIILILLIILMKVIRAISKKGILTEQEKAEIALVNNINKLITEAENSIDIKDMETLKTICVNIENLYNTLKSNKNKKKIYPKIEKLKRAIKIGF